MSFTNLVNSLQRKLNTNVQAKNLTTLRFSCILKYYVEVESLHELLEYIDFAKYNGIKYFILGNGSNIIFENRYYNGLVISLKKLNSVEVNGTSVRVGAGIKIQNLINVLSNQNVGGLEFLSGIPASVGGLIKMNGGAFNDSISNYVVSVDCLKNGKLITIPKSKLKFGYRTSVIESKNPIVSAKFSLKESTKLEIEKLSQNYISRRRVLQPSGSSCGSVFKNPKNDYAGKLIESLGFKGYTYKGIQVSTKHANFIINKNGVSSLDYIEVIKTIQKRVKEEYNVQLEPELEIVK